MARRNFYLARQIKADEAHFDQDEWSHRYWRDQKTGHIMYHVAKAAGKIVTGDDEVLRTQVCGDAAIYRSQLMNTHNLIRSLAPIEPTPAPRELWLPRIAVAASSLAGYLEPDQHEVQVVSGVQKRSVLVAVAALSELHEGIAVHFGLEPEQAHLERMAQMGQP